MKRFLLSLLIFLGLTSVAAAQNPTCPTRPVGDSSNACASTAFVGNAGAAAIPSTTNVLKGSGTAGSAVAAAPGTDYLAPLALPSTTGLYGGTGTAGSATGITVGAGLGLSGGTLSAANEAVSIADYGAVCNGSTDDTTPIQDAWNAAATLGLNVQLSGVGTTCKISSLTMPTPTERSAGVEPPIASMLTGSGPNSVMLVSTVTGTTCAITISTSFDNFEPGGVMGGFALLQTSNTQPSAGGYGICLTNVTQFKIDNVFIRGFTIGLYGVDTINLDVSDSIFYYNNWHIRGLKSSNTNPNVWKFDTDRFGYADQYGIYLSHPEHLIVHDSTFEGNGVNVSLQPATILVDGNPIDGMFGADIRGNYFEFDGGPAVDITSLSGDAEQGSDMIASNVFIRNSETNPIAIVAGATPNVYVNIMSNAFLDNSALTDTYISTSGSSFQAYCLGNAYTDSSDMPTKCQIPAASATWSMDSSAQFGGP